MWGRHSTIFWTSEATCRWNDTTKPDRNLHSTKIRLELFGHRIWKCCRKQSSVNWTHHLRLLFFQVIISLDSNHIKICHRSDNTMLVHLDDDTSQTVGHSLAIIAKTQVVSNDYVILRRFVFRYRSQCSCRSGVPNLISKCLVPVNFKCSWHWQQGRMQTRVLFVPSSALTDKLGQMATLYHVKSSKNYPPFEKKNFNVLQKTLVIFIQHEKSMQWVFPPFRNSVTQHTTDWTNHKSCYIRTWQMYTVTDVSNLIWAISDSMSTFILRKTFSLAFC